MHDCVCWGADRWLQSHIKHGATNVLGLDNVAQLMRAFDWSTTPLGTPDTWPETLHVLMDVILDSKQPMYILWGAEQIMLYNDAYMPILAGRHPASIGQSIRDIWADIWPEVKDQINSACHGEPAHVDDIRLVLHRHGRDDVAHFSFSYTPIRSSRGVVNGMLCACKETTAEVFAIERALTEQQRLISMFEHSPNFFALLTGPDHVFEVANSAAIRLIGNRNIIGKSLADALPDAAAQGFGALLDTVRATGIEHNATGAKYTLQLTPDDIGEDRYLDFIFQPVFGEDGVITSIAVSGSDVTDRIIALAELTKSEQFLKNVLASSKDCIKVLDLDGNIIFMNEAGQTVMEVSDFNELKGCPWIEFWQGDLNQLAKDAIATALSGQVGSFQGEADTMKGTSRYWDVRVTPIANAAGVPINILVVSRDISLLREIDRQRDSLMNEMAHRLKNVLTMTQAIVSQSIRHATSLDDARNTIQGRILALSTAQDILMHSNATTADIRDVVTNALLPHRSGAGRISMSGPELRLEGQQILGLSLAIHELATNAIKYGALSNDNGVIKITWNGSGDSFHNLQWVESGGPAVAPPTRKGFGTKLIQTLVGSYFGGRVDLEYRPEGVTFSLERTPVA